MRGRVHKAHGIIHLDDIIISLHMCHRYITTSIHPLYSPVVITYTGANHWMLPSNLMMAETSQYSEIQSMLECNQGYDLSHQLEYDMALSKTTPLDRLLLDFCIKYSCNITDREIIPTTSITWNRSECLMSEEIMHDIYVIQRKVTLYFYCKVKETKFVVEVCHDLTLIARILAMIRTGVTSRDDFNVVLRRDTFSSASISGISQDHVSYPEQLHTLDRILACNPNFNVALLLEHMILRRSILRILQSLEGSETVRTIYGDITPEIYRVMLNRQFISTNGYIITTFNEIVAKVMRKYSSEMHVNELSILFRPNQSVIFTLNLMSIVSGKLPLIL